VAIATGACGGGSSGGGAGADAAGDRPAAAADGQAQCNQLVADVPQAVASSSTEPAPTPQGGTITSGTYYSAMVTYYSPQASCPSLDPAARAAGKYVFAASSPTAGTVDFIAADSTTVNLRESMSYQIDGTTLDLSIQCGEFASLPDAGTFSGGMQTGAYTATATEILLFSQSAICGTSVNQLLLR
jgi:hypothetical protein